MLLLLLYCSEVLTKTGLIIFICFLPLLFSYSQFGLLFLLIHTASHIPVIFSSPPIIFLSFGHTYLLLYLISVSPFLFLPVLVSHPHAVTLQCLSAWYAVHSHTRCGIEVPTEQQLHLCMLCFCVCDNYHGCQQRETGGG